MACVRTGIEEGAAYDARETVCLRELKKITRREDLLLTVRLENGASKSYRNEFVEGEGFIQFLLVGYHPKTRVYIIGIMYYEGFGIEFLSARSGKTLRITGIPYFSPDGSRFVAIDRDDGHEGTYDLAPGSVANDELSLDWQRNYNTDYQKWHLQRWIDNDHVALRVFSWEDFKGTCPKADCDATLVRSGKSWT